MNDTDRTQKEWMEEKFRFMERDRAAEINQIEFKYKEKVAELKQTISILWMTAEDNLNFLAQKDNLISDMTKQTKVDQDYIKDLESKAKQMTDE